jgi:hypothetical protein
LSFRRQASHQPHPTSAHQQAGTDQQANAASQQQRQQ